ncbi:MAG: 50S ribosome-binding GTPase [Candidatus Methanomethylicia archaeon]|nr:50S ribosome-binding GTPase [Candidatus Methanomethylicia archaeon]
MPANLPPQARAAERRYIEAKNLPDKIKYLQEFISTIPEHKGNEKMRGYLRRRLAQLKEELELQKKRRATSSGGGGFSIKKEGAAQIVILGMTGSGKSALLSALTKAKTEIGSHPFTTKDPVPGMMAYEDIQFQLVDTPAVYEGAYCGSSWGTQLLSMARNADGILILLDGADPVNQFNVITSELSLAGITIEKKENKIEIEKTNGGGIQIACTGRMTCKVEEVDKILKGVGVRNAIVRIWGDAGSEDIIEALDQTKMYKPCLTVINKVDRYPEGPRLFNAVFHWDAIGVSATSRIGLEAVGSRIFDSLGIVRVYTKEVGGEPAVRPIIMKRGAKVIDVAKIVHSHLYKNFKYARVWGSSVNFKGERVGADHEIADKDIVEIRIR